MRVFGWSDNSVYGHERIIQTYTDTWRPIIGHLQHGWNPQSGWTFQNKELLRRLSIRYVWGGRQLKYSLQNGIKVRAAVGAPWLYGPIRSKLECPNDQSNTDQVPVIFPLHGTKQHPTDFSHERFSEMSKAEYGDNAIVCLHAQEYKDDNVKSVYTNQGFKVTTLGDIQDIHFLYNLRTLLAQTKFIVTNRISTVVFYAGSIGIESQIVGPAANHLNDDLKTIELVSRIENEFRELSGNKSDLSKYCLEELGSPYIREPDELTDILGMSVKKHLLLPPVLMLSYLSRLGRKLKI